jgi:murein DD-endopeptidase MepM/ murein hydrolase activator NlpD
VDCQTIANHDFKTPAPYQRSWNPRLHPRHWMLIAGTAVGIAFLMAAVPYQAEATRQDAVPKSGIPYTGSGKNINIPLALPDYPLLTPGAPETPRRNDRGEVEGDAKSHSKGTWQTVTVKSGDSLAQIFSRLDISPRQLQQIVSLKGTASDLTRIYPGQTLRLHTTPEGGLVELIYQVNALNDVRIVRSGDTYEVSSNQRTPEWRSYYATGNITRSLFADGQDAGLSDYLIMELADIFGWDIDFALDLRRGDQFTVLFEQPYLDGDRIDQGRIVAAEFINQGNVYQAIRFTDKSGKTDYYSLEGKRLRKAFLRTPVAFTRISSRFSLGRKHPILNRIRAHKGVDYAAPRGTPIKATGSGTIVFRGKKGGYGNTVIIDHGNKYSTLYAHMNAFTRSQRTGSRVRQGQVIGYVGSSGLATGPHLHYEFRINGVHRNPLTVKLPAAEPLKAEYRDEFTRIASRLMATVERIRTTRVAGN